MNKNEIIFELNEAEKIVFELNESSEMLDLDSSVAIVFVQEIHAEKIAFDCIEDLVSSFSDLLSKALLHRLFLDKSIVKDIGYIWNECLQDKTIDLVFEDIEGRNSWIGLNNSLWSTPSNIRPVLDTWIYNDSEGCIIFEITPSYPWHYNDPKDNECFVAYEDWIKDYKPILIRKIPVEIAQNWLNKANDIFQKLICE